MDRDRSDQRLGDHHVGRMEEERLALPAPEPAMRPHELLDMRRPGPTPRHTVR